MACKSIYYSRAVKLSLRGPTVQHTSAAADAAKDSYGYQVIKILAMPKKRERR